jgi:type IV secretory pathway TrbD component
MCASMYPFESLIRLWGVRLNRSLVEDIMNRNVGTVDRAVRVVVGVAALVWAFVTGVTSGLGLALVVVALVLLGTAAIGFCPLYRLLGISTQPRRQSAEPVSK